ncbi:50S ribosomal protein L18 [Patescibacteria group bacterium]|nr:50S ribosomal protein L18 [Patescibacteria group bacterium]MBU1703521.1 50S ribosomal protein L18 [Patescibacteria group bacterium]MBU1953428.1 50S ribosomal protein L18 [Patescibacteria group bacterium]
MKTPLKQANRLRRRIRVRAKIRGTAKRPRLVVFRSLLHHYAQLIDDDKGVTLANASDLKEKKGRKSDKARNIGLKIAEIAKEKKITVCVFDRNGYRYHGRVKAIAEGAREGGLQF